MLNQWAIFLEVILGSPVGHPAVHELSMIINTAEEIKVHIQEQSLYKP